ncbi:purine nucleosidase [Evansella caseinilytica]|uniref:Purine nucleosidase n=1 Tax=Evansella caseinilytica TaxID=1503961 RepID=A0A1H3GVV8_9BACI|nr:nucleoside hydrolase [Evansella caseinilytica]SDY07170.1 purine nucleosidase [Evansella caseinilytica]
MKKVIIDVDTGIDDALAIAYAIRSEALDILGITTCFGNVSVEEATRNTLQVLEVLQAADIPVVPGYAKPLERDHLKGKALHVHGENGLGNVELPVPESRARTIAAEDFILDNLRSFPKQVTYIALGSLTNLAAAIQKDPAIIELVDKVVVMGGAVRVPGNVKPHAEANIYTDPEAADFVFQSGIPLTLVGLDVTLKTLLTPEDVKVWEELDTPHSRFLADISKFYIDFYMRENGLAGCGLHDPLAVGVAIDQEFVKTEPLYVRVDLGEEIGKTYEVGRGEEQSLIDVALEVDAEKFKDHFMQMIVHGPGV